MEWVLVIFMNGWINTPESFKTERECLVASKIFNEAVKKTRDSAISWCTQRIII